MSAIGYLFLFAALGSGALALAGARHGRPRLLRLGTFIFVIAVLGGAISTVVFDA